MMVKIKQAEGPNEIKAAKALFREYEKWLGFDLCFQGFEEEVETLPGKYAPPEGRLLLAFTEHEDIDTEQNEPAGCVAFRKLEDDVCEMKRLYVRPDAQGGGVGRLLIEKLIDEARSAGYKKMRLDTHPPKMAKAVKLYGSYGFHTIPAYYENPMEDILFMELDL